MKHGLPVTATGRVRDAVSLDRGADGREFCSLRLSPQGDVNGETALCCIAVGPVARLLERTVSRGDLITFHGYLGISAYRAMTGHPVCSENAMEISDFSFPIDSDGPAANLAEG